MKSSLGQKTDLMRVLTGQRLKPAASEGPSLPGVPWVVRRHTVLVAATLCWWLPHCASGLAAGERGREMRVLRAGDRVKGWGIQVREGRSWAC